MESNISTPSNFVDLAPVNTGAGTLPRAPIAPNSPLAQTQKNALSQLADSDFPEAIWNLGGVFLYDESAKLLYDFARENFPRRNAAIAELHGAPPCAWTLDWFQARPLISPGKIAERLKKIITVPAEFVLALDNPCVPEELLGDAIGNTLLTFAAQMPRASVSVASETLAVHIRSKFPKLKLRAGTNKAIAENGRGNADYYRKSAENFAVVALHPDDFRNFALLENLANAGCAEKFEITVNDSCVRDCAVREQHMRVLAEIRQNPWSAELLRKRHALLAQARCEEVCGVPARAADVPQAALLPREILRKIYALGFRRFRIQAEALRSEAAFFFSAFNRLFSDKAENWHHRGLVANAMITKILEPAPALTSGLSPLGKRKYD